jgi:hypothetical protein
MTPVDEYRSWIENTKPLIGAKGKKAYAANNETVAKLLKDFESARIPGQADFLVEYERLAARAAQAAESAKSKGAKSAEKEIAAVAKELEALQTGMAQAKTGYESWKAQIDKLLGEYAPKKISQEVQKVRAAAEKKVPKGSELAIESLTEEIQDQYKILGIEVRKLVPGDPVSRVQKVQTDFDNKLNQVVASKMALISAATFGDTAKGLAKERQKVKDKAESDELYLKIRGLRADARKLLPGLEDVGVPAADVKAFERRIEDSTSEDELKGIPAQIEQRRKSQVAIQDGAAKSIKEEIGSAKKLLAEKKTEFAKNKPALKTLEGVEKDLSNLDSLLSASHPDALKGAQITCTRVKRILNAASADGGFGAILTRIGKQEEALKDDSLKKFHQNDVNQLTLRLTKLRDEGIDPFDLAPASKEIDEIEAETKNLIDSEKKLQLWRADIARWLETTKAATRTIDDFLNRPGLFQKIGALFKGKSSMIDVLTKDIADAYNEAGADTADIDAKRSLAQGRIDHLLRLLKMQTDAKAADEQLKKAKDELDKEYGDGAAELKARSDKKDAEKKDRKDWEQELKDFKDAFSKKKGEIRAAKGPKADLKAIEGIFEAAQKAGENNLQAGRDQLAFAKRRLGQLDPKGVSFDTPKELTETAKRWNNALATFSANLDLLATKAEAKARMVPLPAPAVAEIRGKITRAKTLFDAKAFAGAPKLIDTTVPLSERKKIREEVLLQVRRQSDLLLQDPTLALIRRNPFKVTGVARDVRACLDSLELNVLRAVPAK